MQKLGKPKKRARRGKVAALIGTGAFLAGFAQHPVRAATAPPQAQGPQAAGAPTAATAFAIPVQPLADALQRFSAATGIEVLYDPAALRGFYSRAVYGRMTAQEALQLMLRGTDVTYRFVDARHVRISNARVIERVLETAPARSSLAKLPAPLLRTPQTVVTVSNQTLQERNSASLADIMRDVSGISLSAGEGGAQGDAMTVRGFASSGDIYLDGVRDFGEYYRDPFDLDSVEVVEGPSSTIVGPGSAGGFIDQISKKPQLDPLTIFDATGETNDGERLTLDLDRPLGGGAALRFDAMQTSAGVADRDVTDVRRSGIAPAVDFCLGKTTHAELSYEHLTEHDIPDYGIPYLWGAPAPVARNTYYGFSDDEFFENSDITTLNLEHDVNSALTLRNVTRVASYARTFRAGTAAFATPPPLGTPLDNITVERQEHAEDGNDGFFDNQTDVEGHATTGSVVHTFNAGVEVGTETGHDVRPKYAGLPGTSLLDPDEDQPIVDSSETISSNAHVLASTVGLYALDRMQLGPRFELNGGARWDDFSASDIESVTGTHATQEARALTGHAGLVYDVASNGSIYLSYATAFDPAIDNLVLTTLGSLVPPEFDQSYELGSKWSLANDRLTITGDLFDERANNVALSEEGYTSTAVLVGSERLEGAQLQIDGAITDRLSVHAGYTLLNGEILETDESVGVGNELVNVPRNSASVWTTYDMENGWEVGIGANGLTTRFARPAPSTSSGGFIPEVPGYWRLDAMARAPLGNHLDAQLNLYNLTDKEYYDAVYTDHVVPGAGFSAALSIVDRLP